MKLYDYWRSSAAFRVRIALNLKGLEAEREYIHLRRKDQRSDVYLGVNPQGLVPTLIDDNGTRVVQSMAIMEYLDETRPAIYPLMPRDAEDRARVRAVSQAIACDIHPLNNLRVLRLLGNELGLDEDARNEQWYKHWVNEGMEGVEALLNDGGAGQFCHGNTPTMADVCLVPQVYNAQRFGCDLSSFPTVMRINEACLDELAFRDALPENQPDKE
ncbi:MAG: maleylacetoacetate isomerase [Alphaproteobacteria bacterium]|nr:maleylacetoacetate isomerase [Alphaproteobacteria bacterium]HCP00842.1 maleylacetoacetate isomerase [Rhodospirillaceae bacterium]